MDQRVSLITLGVGDLAASTAFYERLGWRRSSQSNEAVTFFDLGGSALGLFGADALKEDAGLGGDTATPDATGFRGVTVAQNQRSKAEVDAVLKAAEQAGARIVKPAEDVFWGGYSGYFADPDGHLWEIAFNPFWPIDDEGRITLPD